MNLPLQLGKSENFGLHSEHLSPWIFSDLQEHIPDALHDADREPCSSQLHAENVNYSSNILTS